MIFICDEATKRFASDALLCQDACNGLGVLGSLSRHLQEVRKTQPDVSLILHPAAFLMLDKLRSLAGRPPAELDAPEGDDVVALVGEWHERLTAAGKNLDTNARNEHELNHAYLARLHELMAIDDNFGHYSLCYEACDKLQKGEPADVPQWEVSS